jgi:4a-hydroxytetrahydrobiopterin dehydratase
METTACLTEITPAQFHEADGTEDWRVLGEGATAFFRTGSVAAGARLVAAIGALDGIDAHRPVIDVRAEGVTAVVATHDPVMLEVADRVIELLDGGLVTPTAVATGRVPRGD